jgi:hypothetical protein
VMRNLDEARQVVELTCVMQQRAPRNHPSETTKSPKP